MDVPFKIEVSMDWKKVSLAGVMALSLVACSRPRNHEPSTQARPRQAPDQLAPGEIIETSEDVFGLPLPDGFKVRSRMNGMVVAEAAVDPEAVQEYVRTRIDGGSLERNEDQTSFVGVHVANPRGDWKGRLRIDVIGQGRFTTLRFVGEPETKPVVDRAIEPAKLAPESAPSDGLPMRRL